MVLEASVDGSISKDDLVLKEYQKDPNYTQAPQSFS